MKKETKNKLVACCVFLIGFFIAIFFMMLAFKPELLAFLKPYSLYIIFLMGGWGAYIFTRTVLTDIWYSSYFKKRRIAEVNKELDQLISSSKSEKNQKHWEEFKEFINKI